MEARRVYLGKGRKRAIAGVQGGVGVSPKVGGVRDSSNAQAKGVIGRDALTVNKAVNGGRKTPKGRMVPQGQDYTIFA